MHNTLHSGITCLGHCVPQGPSVPHKTSNEMKKELLCNHRQFLPNLLIPWLFSAVFLIYSLTPDLEPWCKTSSLLGTHFSGQESGLCFWHQHHVYRIVLTVSPKVMLKISVKKCNPIFWIRLIYITYNCLLHNDINDNVYLVGQYHFVISDDLSWMIIMTVSDQTCVPLLHCGLRCENSWEPSFHYGY